MERRLLTQQHVSFVTSLGETSSVMFPEFLLAHYKSLPHTWVTIAYM